MTKKFLTGITPSGSPHIGNYIGAIKPAILLAESSEDDFFYFISDYHAIIKCQDKNLVKKFTFEIAATWLALGLDPSKVVFYRQSKIPQILELCWILTCSTPKGLINRAHAYKAATDLNISQSKDIDHNISMGLYSYPILMAADILLFKTNIVPVGKDQVQHIEIARDIAGYFNQVYGNIFTLPNASIATQDVLVGLDGRKMSKSYNNTIQLFSEEKNLRKSIMQIVTNSLLPGEPKDYNNCTLFKIFKEFASAEEIEHMKYRYANGISWGEMKENLFNKINKSLSDARLRYNHLISNPTLIEESLSIGEEIARTQAESFLSEIRCAVGVC